jgi:WD40 repeat protein
VSTEEHFERRVFEALSADAAATGWNAASTYLKRHMAAHAQAAHRLDDLVGQTDYLANADAAELDSAMRSGLGPDAQTSGVVFRASLDVQRHSPERRIRAQRLLIDAFRADAPESIAISDRTLWRPVICLGRRPLSTRLDILSHAGDVTAVALGEIGGRAVALTGSEDWIARIWDAATGTALTMLIGHTKVVTAVALGKAGGRAIALTGSWDQTARIWDAATGTQLATLTGHVDDVNAVAFGEIGGRAVALTGSWDQTARIWDAATGTQLATLTGHTRDVTAVAVGKIGGRAVALTGSRDQTARIWDAATGTELVTLDHIGQVGAVALGEVGGRAVALTASSDGTARIWDAATGTQLATLTGHTDWVKAVALGEVGGLTIAITASGRTARIWDAATGTQVDCMELPGSVRKLDFNARRLAVTYQAEVLILKAPDQLWSGQ